MTNRTNPFIASCIACLCPFVANAEQPTQANPVVVTASRLAQTQDETLASVTVVTRDEIQRLQPQSMLDLLRVQPGIDLNRTGGLGGNTSLFLRGTESDHVLVLINGVRASSATTGQFAWHHLDPAQVERIEIVRGPRASLYGSDAIGGVIQIFTRQPEHATGSVTAGSFDTYRAQAGWGAQGDTVQGSINASWADSEGFSAQNREGLSFDPDDDGYRNRSVSARLRARLGDTAHLTLNGWHSGSDIEFDQGTQDGTNQTVRATLSHDVTTQWHQRLGFGYAYDDLEIDSAFPAALTTRRQSLNWQHDIGLGLNHLLILGLDYYQDEARNRDLAGDSTVFDETIHDTAAYARWQGRFGNHDLQAGLRYDEHSEFGGHTTGQLAWGHALSDADRVVVSYGTAFKAPNVNELFHPGFGGQFAGNPELEPERSQSVEVSFRHQAATQRMEANLFYTRVDDLIAFEGADFRAINVNEVTIPGLELVYRQSLDPWTLGANLTLQRPRNNDDQPLLSRPDEKLAVTVGRRLPGGGDVNAEVLLAGERRGLTETLPGYGVVNLSARHPVGEHWQMEARVENLLDKDYTLTSGYNTPDLSAYVGLRYRPGAR